LISAEMIRAIAGSLDGCEFLLCGPVPMMHALRQQLRDAGVRRDRIHFEELSFR